MKDSGLLIATLATALVAIFAVKAAGWFEGSSGQKAVCRASITDAERWYRTGQPRHWRCHALQSR